MPPRPADSGRPPRAKRSLGQNFLIDPNAQRRIVDALDPSPGDEVMEIGPGQGALTRHLAERAGRLTLVELDDELARRLAEEFAGNERVRVIHRDVLQVPLEEVTSDPARLKVIGNIPYNITTPILFGLLERRPRPREIVLMVQKEVADRILADAGNKTYGALAVGVRAVADAERVMNVGRKSFRPIPDVESSVIRIVPHDPPRVSPEDERALRRLTRAAFGQRRKQFQRILRDAYGLSVQEVEALGREVGMDLQSRPESFPPERFVELAHALRKRSEDVEM
ncbi:MAG TPA: 16S rRNA (adenine(1518)-N(6)/adenine(1519)-N(6))-dimethyltransferase RsmA [Longimicrobium sp.]|nr:16S rRNA (adenine(1518)-N(6)/adenine(1519)-N(6))-dimethyltransferase RsmA [Longimicrobium sp.]